MRKISCLIVALGIVICLFGCSSKISVLEEDEYYVYENGTAIFALTDIDWEAATLRPFTFAEPFRYFWDGHEEIIESDDTKIYDLSNNDISTKRGLKVGDTLRQFAESYASVEMDLPDYRISITPSELLKNREEYELDDVFIVRASTSFLLDGTPKGSFDNEEGVDYYRYTLTITFEYNSITDIEIDYNS